MPWYWVGVQWRLGLALLVAIVIVGCYYTNRSRDLVAVGTEWWYAGSSAMLIGMALLHFWLGSTVRSEVDLYSPLGTASFYITQGGGNILVNHHHSDPVQRYAADIVVLGNSGKRARNIYAKELDEYFSFNYPLTAPCAGIVRAMKSTLADQSIGRTDTQNLAGNFVLIGCGNYSVLLAHLKHDSSPVLMVGDHVNVGQLIGHIGNSGNTTEPHLHLQVVTHLGDADAAFPLSGVGVPFTIAARVTVRGLYD